MDIEIKDLERLSAKAQEDYHYVRKAINGDQKAYSVLMDRYRGAIYNMMYKMVNNKEDADDLTLEAFGKAFSKLESYAPRYAFSTWLFKIAVNNSIDYIRKKRLNFYSLENSLSDESDFLMNKKINADNLDPEEIIIRQQRLRLIRGLLKKLSVKYRLMIELRYFEGLSYEQIARELNIPLGTVKAQLFRAKQILFNLLQSGQTQYYMDNRVKKER